MKELEEFNHNQSGDPQLVGLAIVKLAQMSNCRTACIWAVQQLQEYNTRLTT